MSEERSDETKRSSDETKRSSDETKRSTPRGGVSYRSRAANRSMSELVPETMMRS